MSHEDEHQVSEPTRSGGMTAAGVHDQTLFSHPGKRIKALLHVPEVSVDVTQGCLGTFQPDFRGLNRIDLSIMMELLKFLITTLGRAPSCRDSG